MHWPMTAVSTARRRRARSGENEQVREPEAELIRESFPTDAPLALQSIISIFDLCLCSTVDYTDTLPRYYRHRAARSP